MHSIDKENLDNQYQYIKYLLIILKFLICQVLNNENQSYKAIIDDFNAKIQF